MNKFVKQFISITLSLILLFSASSAFASSGNGNQSFDFSVEKNYGEMFLKSLGHSQGLYNPVPLFNLDDELEAVSFSIGKKGYIIINVKDLSVPELSLEASSPFKNPNEVYVYNGPLAYMYKSGSNLADLKTGGIVKEPQNVKFKYKKSNIDKTEKFNSLLENVQNSETDESVSIQSILVEEYLSTALKKWYKDPEEGERGYCGPIAMAILTQFYDDVVSDSFVASTNENEGLIDIMIDFVNINGDASNGTTSTEVVDGLNEYLDDRGLYFAYRSSYSTYSFSTVTSRIDDNRPVIVGLADHPYYKNHWVIGHGYVITTSTNYVVVNDGWEHNNVWIEDGDHMDYTVKLLN